MRRALPAVIAIVVCGWFALGVRQAHDVDAADNIITAPRPSPAHLRAAASRLDAAAFLNSDRTVDILRGRVAIEQGRLALARRILRTVVSAEPQNLEGWIWFTGANLGRPAAVAGSRRIASLDPLDARAVGR